MKTYKKLLVFLSVLMIIIGSGFVVWGATPSKAMPEAINSMQSNEQVFVEAGKWLVFSPQTTQATTGYILYPGGRVDYRSYSPYARTLAEKGYLVVIPHMPLNLAVFCINSASTIIAAFPEVEHWVIGGHSLGGSMAADFVAKNPSKIEGLVLLAAYPASSDDLIGYTGVVMSISGLLDGLATPDKIEASRKLLPISTKWVMINGGNHAYFGWYGSQKGDNEATIKREIQQSIIIQKTLELLKKVGNNVATNQ